VDLLATEAGFARCEAYPNRSDDGHGVVRDVRDVAVLILEIALRSDLPTADELFEELASTHIHLLHLCRFDASRFRSPRPIGG
jgi:hypothetical protein